MEREPDEFEPEEPKSPLTPVTARARHDGWTVERQYASSDSRARVGANFANFRRTKTSLLMTPGNLLIGVPPAHHLYP